MKLKKVDKFKNNYNHFRIGSEGVLTMGIVCPIRLSAIVVVLVLLDFMLSVIGLTKNDVSLLLFTD